MQLLVVTSYSADFLSHDLQYYKPDAVSTDKVVKLDSELHTQLPVLGSIVVEVGSHFMHLNDAADSDKGNVKPGLHSQSLFPVTKVVDYSSHVLLQN